MNLSTLDEFRRETRLAEDPVSPNSVTPDSSSVVRVTFLLPPRYNIWIEAVLLEGMSGFMPIVA